MGSWHGPVPEHVLRLDGRRHGDRDAPDADEREEHRVPHRLGEQRDAAAAELLSRRRRPWRGRAPADERDRQPDRRGDRPEQLPHVQRAGRHLQVLPVGWRQRGRDRVHARGGRPEQPGAAGQHRLVGRRPGLLRRTGPERAGERLPRRRPGRVRELQQQQLLGNRVRRQHPELRFAGTGDGRRPRARQRQSRLLRPDDHLRRHDGLEADPAWRHSVRLGRTRRDRHQPDSRTLHLRVRDHRRGRQLHRGRHRGRRHHQDAHGCLAHDGELARPQQLMDHGQRRTEAARVRLRRLHRLGDRQPRDLRRERPHLQPGAEARGGDDELQRHGPGPGGTGQLPGVGERACRRRRSVSDLLDADRTDRRRAGRAPTAPAGSARRRWRSPSPA